MIKLFTHTDLDGVGCYILAFKAFGNNVKVEYCNYNDINERVLKFINNNEIDEACYITDISVSEEVANIINSKYDNFYLFDHHGTALGLNKYSWCNVKISNEETGIDTCGTELFYNYLIQNNYLEDSKALKNFVNLVRDYDTWRWSTLGDEGIICKQVNDLFGIYGFNKFITWSISQIHDNVFPKLYAADELVLSIKQKEIDDYIERKNKNLIKKEILGYKAGVVFAENYMSELGNKLSILNPDCDFIAIIDISGNKISYRTIKDNIDLGKDVAAKFEGGGHAKAAGSQIPNEFVIDIVSNLFN